MARSIRTRVARNVRSMNAGLARWDGADALTALKEVGGYWKPQMETIHRPDGSVIEGKRGVVNPLANTHLGVTSDNYAGIDNALIAEGLDRFAKAVGKSYRVSNAYCLDGGRLVGVEAILGDGVTVIAKDTVFQTVSCFQGHGGNLPFSFLTEWKRLVCTNGLMMRVPGLNTAFRCKHTAQGVARVEWNFSLVQKAFAESAENMQAGFARLAEKQLSREGAREFFKAYAETVLKQDGEKLAQTVADLTTIYNYPRNADAGTNYWSAFNALTEWNQHYGFRTDEAMILANIAGPALRHKTDAFQFALAQAA
jgi:hypothetical protein